nr:hypothetical protein [Tanacetum cinerariifolium]
MFFDQPRPPDKVIFMFFFVAGVDENIIEERYHKFIQIVLAFLKELICRVLGLLVPLLALNRFGILLGELKEGWVDLQENFQKFSGYSSRKGVMASGAKRSSDGSYERSDSVLESEEVFLGVAGE